jgi:hypothetical protein
MSRDHELDHFLPRCDRPDIARDYDNLVFACRECNGSKSAKLVPSPEAVAYGECLRVDDEGVIHPRNNEGELLIEAMRLNSPEFTSLRRDIIQMVKEARSGTTSMKRLLGYPDALPNLAEEPPPKSNTRSGGVKNSHFERQRRNELAEYY